MARDSGPPRLHEHPVHVVELRRSYDQPVCELEEVHGSMFTHYRQWGERR
jgi:hypothetical protein